MNHKVVFSLFHVFVNRGFSVLRFNTRGVGRSQAASTTAWASSATPPPRSTGCRA